MVTRDVMIGVDRKDGIYYFFADGREIKVEGDMAFYRVCLMLQNAMGRKEENYGENRAEIYSRTQGQ